MIFVILRMADSGSAVEEPVNEPTGNQLVGENDQEPVFGQSVIEQPDPVPTGLIQPPPGQSDPVVSDSSKLGPFIEPTGEEINPNAVIDSFPESSSFENQNLQNPDLTMFPNQVIHLKKCLSFDNTSDQN